MKKSIFVKLLMVSVFVLGAVGVTSCRKEPVNPETPKITFDYADQKDLTALTLNVTAEGTEASGIDIIVNANYEWKVKESDIAEGITINPKTAKKGETTVNIKVDAFEDGREVAIKFELVNELPSATLTIKQSKKGTPVEGEVLYFEDAGTNPDAAAGNPNVANFTNWSRKSPAGLDQSAVTYSGDATVRASGANSSVEGFSGHPNIFMNSDNATRREFVIGNINVGDNTKLIFKAAGVVSVYPDYVAKTPEFVEFYAGYDGESWAQLEIITDEVTGYSWVSSEFSVESGTSKVFIKIVTKNHQIRWDDLTLAAGGNGALIDVPTIPDPVEKTLTEIRAMATGTITDNYFFTASIISDASATGGNSTSKKNIIVSDGTSGIMIRVKADPEDGYFKVGDEVKVNVMNATLSVREDLLQIEADNSKISKTGQTKAIGYKEIAAADLLTGNYESMLVAVKDVQFNIADAGKPIGSSEAHSAWKMEDKNGEEFDAFVAKWASFVDTAIPSNSGTIKGIGSINKGVYQVLPQTAADLDGLDQPRFGEDDNYFSVTTSDNLNVSATDTSVQFTVSANVSWSVQPVDVSDYNNFTIHPAIGDGSASVTVSFGENTSTTDGRYFKLKFSTSDEGVPAGNRSYEFTINQAKASGGGGLPAGTVLYKETWGSFGSHAGVTVADYDKSGTTTYQSGDASSINYGSSGANVKVYNHPDSGASGYVAPSNGYEGFSGSSMLLVPKSSRGEVVKVEGVKLYDATSFVFSMGSRQAADKITVKYTFNTGGSGTFVVDTSSPQYDSYWQKHTFQPVNVPTGATNISLEFSAQMDSNIRVDDFEIKAN